jgi:hypothetical protein
LSPPKGSEKGPPGPQKGKKVPVLAILLLISVDKPVDNPKKSLLINDYVIITL